MSNRDEEGTAETSQVEPAAESKASGRQPVSAEQRSVQRTRTSGIWTAVAFAVIVLLLLLIFILQNLQPVAVSYFGATGQLPLGVALLLGAVGGALLVIVIGAARILQLRRLTWKYRRQEKKSQRQEASDAAHEGG